MTDDVDADIVDWQEAVDLAHTCLALDSARRYGLVAGGPPVNVERCEEVLAAGAARGFRPAADAIERYMSPSGGDPR